MEVRRGIGALCDQWSLGILGNIAEKVSLSATKACSVKTQTKTYPKDKSSGAVQMIDAQTGNADKNGGYMGMRHLMVITIRRNENF